MPLTNTIQGQDAIVALFKDDWLPFVCGSNVSIEITCTKVAIRTRGDGHWKKYTYQDAEFSITLSGVLVFDDENWSGWDMLDQQFNFTHVLARVSFDDQNGDVKTVQGYVMIEQSTLSWAAGDVVKDDFQIQGNGSLIMFDGLIPCPTVITSITVTGQEASDGTVHVAYTYTGEAYQIKYRIDNTGDYVYALADLVIDIPGLSVTSHTIEIIPVCVNGYEGTGDTQDFVVTKALTCSTSVTGLTIHQPSTGIITGGSIDVTVVTDGTGPYFVVNMTGAATTFMIAIDGGMYIVYPTGTQIPITSLGLGQHNIAAIPICTFDGGQQVLGPGESFDFTLNAQPSQSQITYNYVNIPTGNSFDIYVNGVLTIAASITNASGTFAVPVGAIIKAILTSSNLSHRAMTLTVDDTTAGTVPYNNSATSPSSMNYSFTADGHAYTIIGEVTP